MNEYPASLGRSSITSSTAPINNTIYGFIFKIIMVKHSK